MIYGKYIFVIHILFHREEIQKKRVDEVRNISKILPYVNGDNIVNIYKINNQSPNSHNLYIPASNRYRNNIENKYYLKNSENKNHERQKKNSLSNNYFDLSQNYGSPNIKIVPNRKLSPINKKIIKI